MRVARGGGVALLSVRQSDLGARDVGDEAAARALDREVAAVEVRGDAVAEDGHLVGHRLRQREQLLDPAAVLHLGPGRRVTNSRVSSFAQRRYNNVSMVNDALPG